MAKMVLASASPRRRELLSPFFPELRVVPSTLEENAPHHASLEEGKALAEELALSKARSVAEEMEGAVVVGADTLVLLEGRVLGKPRDRGDAEGMLSLLSGRTHQVVTGIAVVCGQEEHTAVVVSHVTFLSLSPSTIAFYLDREDYGDKAGAYAIQSDGWRLVKKLEGSWSNVVGLPLSATSSLLSFFSVDLDTTQGPVVVVAGMPGAGKEEFVRAARSRSYAVVRMGDVVREEASKHGADSDDRGIGGFASSERERQGPRIWAERSMERLNTLDAYNVVVDGTRSHHEVTAFREALGSRVHLVAITATQENRYKRLVSRKRGDAPESFEAFRLREEREKGWGIDRALEMADATISNDGSLEEFRKSALHFLDAL